MTIQAGGLVGINKTPVVSQGQLQVAGGISTTAGINLQGTGGIYAAASKGGIDQNGAILRFYSYGANTTTRGSMEWHNVASDGTLDNVQMSLSTGGQLQIIAPGTAFNAGLTLESGAVAPGNFSPALVFSAANNNAAIYSYRYGSYGGDLIFATQTGGSAGAPAERMRVFASGNVGIGTGSVDYGNKLTIGANTTGIVNEIYCAGQYNTFEGLFAGEATTNGGAKIDLNTHSSAATSGSYRIVHETDTYGVGNLVFAYAVPMTTRASLSYTHFARFNSNGKFCIGLNGTGDPSGTRTLGTAIDSQGGINLYTGTATSAYGLNVTSGSHMLFYTDNGSRIGAGNISSSGSTTSYNTTSDVRLKENINDASSTDSIIDAIQIREFDFKTGGHVRFGFVAQELVEIAPEAVTRGDDGEAVSESWGVDPSKLVAMLVKEIQELRARVAVLEAK